MKLIRTKIAAHIRETGMSQRDLARELRLSPSQLGCLGAGRANPSVVTLRRLARYFKLTQREIAACVLGARGEPPGPKTEA